MLALVSCGGGCTDGAGNAVATAPSKGDAGRSEHAGTGGQRPGDGSNLGDAARDGGSHATSSDGGRDAGARDGDKPLDSGADACATGSCDSLAACSDEQPCGASDEVCIADACTADPGAPGPEWQRSAWNARAGRVGDDDRTLWCTPSIAAPADAHAAQVTSAFELVLLDATHAHEVTASDAAQRVRFQCFASADLSGPSTTVTSRWSVDGDGDQITARCPKARPHAAFARCQVAAASKPPYVYAGTACGNGAAGLTGAPVLHGQLIGDHYELSGPAKPLFNDTGAQGGVVGTDLGYQFLAQGRMYVGFGDTWENDATAPGPNGFRGSVLANTRDFDPSDDNGIAFDGWDTAPDHPSFAREIVPCPHDQSGNSEFTAIAAAGFGLSDGTVGYRFVWFAAIKTWDPFTTNESTLAWSQDGKAFERGDQAVGMHPPRWPFSSHFGPGAIWVDREQGYIYFFGVRTYQAEQPIRLARVRGTLAAVRDHLQYEYWTGSAWQQPDPGDEYALASSSDSAADLVPGTTTQSTRPEISVAYNPYVGRFTMMVQNDRDAFTNEPQERFQLWQSEAIEGPWTLVNTGDDLVMASTLYGPYMSEQTMVDGGRDVYFALSDWNLQPLALGQPYVAGLWSMSLTRDVLPGCEE